MAELEEKEDKNFTCFQHFRARIIKLWFNDKIGIKFQELSINFYPENANDITINGKKQPKFEWVLMVFFKKLIESGF